MIAFGLLILACSSSATQETSIKTAVSGDTLTSTLEAQTATVAYTQESPSETIILTKEPTKSSIGKVGDTITQGDYIITLVKTETATSYGDFSKADAGNKFVSVEIIIESGAESGVSVNPLYCKLADGDAYSYTISFFGKDPSLGSQNDLPKGEKMRGWVTFEVPETAKDFIFSYEPLSFTEKIRIRFNLGF
jgi:hypothetical protein